MAYYFWESPVQYIVGIFCKNDKFLLVYKHSSSSDKCKNRWEIPGGRAKFGLSFEEALKEKMRDYLGVEVTVGDVVPKIVSNISEESDVTKHYYVIAAKCKLDNENISLNPAKLNDYRWFDLAAINEMEENRILVAGDIELLRMCLTEK